LRERVIRWFVAKPLTKEKKRRYGESKEVERERVNQMRKAAAVSRRVITVERG
jgi:hypothetical protein